MPPKRRGGRGQAAKGAKKGKIGNAAPATVKDAIVVLKEADKGKRKIYKPDPSCSLASTTEVFEDYNCMLNQTNIGQNNNKYYVIQVLKDLCSEKYYAWNRWGRVGEPGKNSLKGPLAEEIAVADFKKKFQDKTKNKWDERSKFKAEPRKYTLIEMATSEDADEVDAGPSETSIVGFGKTVVDSLLDKPTQELMKLIFDHDMFKDAMKSFDIDVKKMPLGKLSKAQIAKGFECLEEIEKAVKNNQKGKINELSSQFYTLIPHNFGRKVPKPINDEDIVRQKKDMLLVLADIELAQSLQKEIENNADKDAEVVANPLDDNYKLLNCKLDLLDSKTVEYKIIQKYLDATKLQGCTLKILNIWSCDRNGEREHFKEHDKLGNQKLLWHGTNVAVVAAILKSGLRIMPHSGGRVGKGIYFASENGKSYCYVTCAGKIGIMFLSEVALGKEKHIMMDDCSLTAPPKGYDSVVAKGRTEPDKKHDTVIKIEGKEVVVPQGKPVEQSKFSKSSFSQSEYLVYRESQCRLRYLLKLQF